MSLKHAILGFLSLAPMSGYDLKKAFDSSVRHFWPADQAQIYRTLAALAGEGLATVEDTDQDDPLSRKVYHVTPDGRAELRRWLTSPPPQTDDREPFLIQLFFASLLSDEEAAALLERQRAAVAEQLAAYEAMYRAFANAPTDRPRALFYTLLTLEQVIVQGRPYLAWLERAMERARDGDYRAELT
jgi:DNA-binding PadR family transcriptional regulator